jgi:death on curing protein
MRLILLQEGLDIETSQEDKYEMVISANTGSIRSDEIKSWLSSRLKKHAL